MGSIYDLLNIKPVEIQEKTVDNRNIYDQIKKPEVSLEARNVLKDKTFKLNKSAFYVAEKSINESALLFSFLDEKYAFISKT